MSLKFKKLGIALAIASISTIITTPANAFNWADKGDVANIQMTASQNQQETNQNFKTTQSDIKQGFEILSNTIKQENEKYNKLGNSQYNGVGNAGQSQQTPDGLSKPSEVNSTINDAFSGGTTVPDAIKRHLQAMEKIRLDEQANVAVYLDSAVGNVPCKPGGTCTILKYLQEQVANQVDTLQKDVVDAGAYWLDPSNKMTAPSRFTDLIYRVGFQEKIANPGTASKDPQVIASFLSPAPMVPAGFEPDYTKGALTPERAKVLGDALVGLSDFRSYLDSAELRQVPSGSIVQAKIMTRFARMQLARHAIMQVNHKSVTDAMNVEFKACVIRPNKEDSVKAHMNQHLVNIEQLLKCNNLSLMHMRRLQMEQSRLLGAMLATQLDQWAFSTSQEEGNTINYVPVK